MALLKTVGAGPEVGKLFLAVGLLLAGEIVTKQRELVPTADFEVGGPVAFSLLRADGELMCTQEVKRCSDGSYVGRDSKNNCEFRPCPGPHPLH